MTALCIAAAGAIAAVLPIEAFTLTWTHSVERVPWREEWRIVEDRLQLVEASVAGSGAGMEPSAGARLERGAWVHRPAGPAVARLALVHSSFADDYALCWRDGCRPLSDLVPVDVPGGVVLYPCGR